MLFANGGIANHLRTVPQAHLGAILCCALHHRAVAARAPLLADLAPTIHVCALSSRTVLYARFLGRAFHVFAQTSKTILIALFSIPAGA